MKNFSIEDFGIWLWTFFWFMVLPLSLSVGVIRWAFS